MTNRKRDESAATAVLVGIMCTLLFAVAAMSVDLGNAWARKRTLQSQVDVTAVSSGWKLPATTSPEELVIAGDVAGYLNEEENSVLGQDDVTASQLLDGDNGNGEVVFTNSGETMQVISPSAKVSFFFARVFGSGFGSTHVQADATVQVMTALPDMGKVVPFWIPQGCAFGPTFADTTGGAAVPPPAPTTTTSSPSESVSAGAFVPPESRAAHTFGSMSETVAAFGSTRAVTLTINNLKKNTDRATIRFTFDSGNIKDYETKIAPKVKADGSSATVSFTVDTGVTNTAGTWQVWPLVKDGNAEYPAGSPGTFTVTGGAPSAPASSSTAPSPTATSTVTCTGQNRGNFGQLESPRADESHHQLRFAANIAAGLDHLLVPFINAPAVDCESPNDIGQWDDTVRAGNNCIQGDTGNDGPAMLDGLITGTTGGIGYPGRLDAAAHGNTRTGCNGGVDVEVEGVQINNDVLSCYLRNGATLTQISSPDNVDENMMDPAILDSPRFIWLSVVYANSRSIKHFQPIESFVPAFITDETTTTTATADNGLTINGNSVKSLQVFTFNSASLPLDERAPTTDYTGDPGGSIVRLID